MVFSLAILTLAVLIILMLLLIYVINVILSGVTPLLALGLAMLILFYFIKNSGLIKKMLG